MNGQIIIPAMPPPAVNRQVTVRYCKAVSFVDSTGYRVLYGGEIYNILGIDHKNFKKRSVKLKCQKVRR